MISTVWVFTMIKVCKIIRTNCLYGERLLFTQIYYIKSTLKYHSQMYSSFNAETVLIFEKRFFLNKIL